MRSRPAYSILQSAKIHLLAAKPCEEGQKVGKKKKAQLTECSSESDVWDERIGLKLAGDRGPSFFLMARIWSSARKAVKRETGRQDMGESGGTRASTEASPAGRGG